MILSCNSCGKKFVVPDNAITQSGRLVQCSACGNKWKQFPVTQTKKEKVVSKPVPIKASTKKIATESFVSAKKTPKSKKKIKKKTREINLYSPEYLAKKHGIRIKDYSSKSTEKSIVKEKVAFGFYSSLIVFLVFVVFFSRTLYFAQNFIITLLPVSEFYLEYFFENIRNLFEIWKSLVTYY